MMSGTSQLMLKLLEYFKKGEISFQKVVARGGGGVVAKGI